MIDQEVAAVQVAVDAPLKNQLTYLQNENFSVSRGQIVTVPLGKRQVRGVVIGPAKSTDLEKAKAAGFDLKRVISVDDEWPALKDPFLKWLEWLAQYYAYPAAMQLLLSKRPLELAPCNNGLCNQHLAEHLLFL